MIWLYLGPEVIAPVASALAALGGVLLMFWRRVSGFFRMLFRLGGRRDTDSGSTPTPVED